MLAKKLFILLAMIFVLYEGSLGRRFLEMQLLIIAFHMVLVLFLLSLICYAKSSFLVKRIFFFNSNNNNNNNGNFVFE